jgi:hypothetical protein
MPSLKAKKLRKHPQEKVLLELCRRLANSICPFVDIAGLIRSGAGGRDEEEWSGLCYDQHLEAFLQEKRLLPP